LIDRQVHLLRSGISEQQDGPAATRGRQRRLGGGSRPGALDDEVIAAGRGVRRCEEAIDADRVAQAPLVVACAKHHHLSRFELARHFRLRIGARERPPDDRRRLDQSRGFPAHGGGQRAGDRRAHRLSRSGCN
jgi:hypothetical protein